MSLGLYVHVPFCLSRCHYCDFFSLPADHGSIDAYLDALETEACLYRETGKVASVYVGGGTPTCLPASKLRRLLQIIASFDIHPRAEFTCEANPGTITAEKLRLLQDAGVNRLSIGLQSVFNHHLRQLGRIHRVEGFLQSYEAARRAGFYNISFDLIYALPGMTAEEWQQTLQLAVSLHPEHISVYNLTLEPGRPLQKWHCRGLLPALPDEAREAQAFTAVHRHLTVAGYCHYEIASFALPGWEGRHNLNYWRRGEYIGLGPGASGFLQGERYTNRPALKSYCRRLKEGGPPERDREKLTKIEAMGETVMLGLRMLQEGVNPEYFKDTFACLPRQVFPLAIDKMLYLGLLQETREGRLLLTEKGMILADSVIQEFLGNSA